MLTSIYIDINLHHVSDLPQLRTTQNLHSQNDPPPDQDPAPSERRCLASHEDRGADLERRLAVHDELRTHARGGAAAPRVGEEQRRAAQETEEDVGRG